MTTTSARTNSGSKTKANSNSNSGSSPKGRGGKPAGGKTSRQRVEDAVADRIIELLDQGQLPPWEKDWRDSTNGTPLNAVSMKPYRGVNRWMTLLTHMVMGYQDPRWLTYRQAEALGGHVRKGERSTEIVFWKRVPVRDREDGGGNAPREAANREAPQWERTGNPAPTPCSGPTGSSTWNRPRTAGSSPCPHPRRLPATPPPTPHPRCVPPVHRHPQALRNHPGSQLLQQQVEPAPDRSPLLFGFPHCPHLSRNWAKYGPNGPFDTNQGAKTAPESKRHGFRLIYIYFV